MLESAFLLGFCLHQLEEALFLPAWSVNAGRFHPQVGAKAFRFAVGAITAVGMALFGASHVFSWEGFRAAWVGFVLMMGANAVFPHAIASVALRRYAPGTLTGLLFNLPLAAAIGVASLRHGQDARILGLAFATATLVSILSLRPLFRLGTKWLGPG